MGILKIKDTRTEEERELCEKLSAKMAEYKAKFDDDFCTEFLPMTKAEIIEDIVLVKQNCNTFPKNQAIRFCQGVRPLLNE